MAYYQDHAVVLKSKAYRESDSLVTVFGLKAGKVSAIAKGVRRPKSPMAAGLYPLSYAVVDLYRGRSSLDTITNAELVDGFGGVRGDLARMSWGLVLADLVDELWSAHDAAPRAFALLVGGLDALNQGRHPVTVGLATGWQLLRAAGYCPDWSRCTRCGASLASATGRIGVDVDHSAVLCPACAAASPKGRWVGLGAVRTLAHWLELEPSRLGTIEAKGRVKEELWGLLQSYASRHVGRVPRSFEFLNTVERMPDAGGK